jgi:CO/xanthine dehydrogenase FAD-binding subunit
MKPVAFDYQRVFSVQEACAALAASPDALLIAGGQTLMPMLAMRLARPAQLIDILRVPGLNQIAVSDTHVTLGAATRQVSVEFSPEVASELPLLSRVMPWVGHPPTRRRGTVGGSIANADATAEIGLVTVALGADVLIESAADGAAHIPAGEFFLGPMVTALPHGAMVAGLRFPRRASRQRVGTGFAEIAQRHGDFAMAAAAVELALAPDGTCREIALAVGGATYVPTRLELSGLLGATLSAERVSEAVTAALQPLDMLEDTNTTGSYRRRAAIALAGQAVAMAVADSATREGRA